MCTVLLPPGVNPTAVRKKKREKKKGLGSMENLHNGETRHWEKKLVSLKRQVTAMATA
jgi:hypothetical protein